MSTQPEALRLADVSRLSRHHEWHLQVDAELRRQHGEIKSMQAERRHTERRLLAVEAQRDALLEALRLARSIIGHPDDAHSQMIDAAVKAVEGEKA